MTSYCLPFLSIFDFRRTMTSYCPPLKIMKINNFFRFILFRNSKVFHKIKLLVLCRVLRPLKIPILIEVWKRQPIFLPDNKYQANLIFLNIQAVGFYDSSIMHRTEFLTKNLLRKTRSLEDEIEI